MIRGSETSTGEILVHLVRPGDGAREYHLAEGSSLADLLRLSGASAMDRAILIDGAPPEEGVALREGMVVTIGPRSREAAIGDPWRAEIPAFRDDALFEEYAEVLEARRREAGPEEGRGG